MPTLTVGMLLPDFAFHSQHTGRRRGSFRGSGVVSTPWYFVRPDFRSTPMVLDQQYISMKNQVIKAERRVLKELGFCVHVKHPHKLITTYLKVLEHSDDIELVQKAWNYMNDGLRTDIFLRHPPETVACACIYLAARVNGLPLPTGWWQLFDAEESQLVDICRTLLKMYKRKRPSWTELEGRAVRLRKEAIPEEPVHQPATEEVKTEEKVEKFSPQQKENGRSKESPPKKYKRHRSRSKDRKKHKKHHRSRSRERDSRRREREVRQALGKRR